MADPFEIGVRRYAPGDHTSDWIDDLGRRESMREQSHPLDSDQARAIHKRLLCWFLHERTRQADNRLEMALDADFYDGMQWDPEDAAVLQARGQVPLVYNEVAPVVDWLIGTERRTRVDWRVLPRTEDDVELADVKGKVLKYVSDVNHVQWHRSQAFADAVKVGIGWLDDGARDDPTSDVLYSTYESWRNVLWDSSGYSYDGSDWRYIFRWRWVDADIAEAMFPDRRAQIRRVIVEAGLAADQDLDWFASDRILASGTGIVGAIGVAGDGSRPRVRLIECQFRMPAKVMIVASGPLKGSFVSPHDLALIDAASNSGSDIIEKVAMRVHVAVFTDSDLLSLGPSVYRHNRFSLTPIWCYRRNKDRMPYGVIRRVRDVQRDLNKRASKALFLLSTNQIIAEKGAVEDKSIAREEADMPDGYIEVVPGKQFNLRRDADQATGQIQLMSLDAQSIQRTIGVNNENLGRQTNAISGEAIKARQFQGSVATTEIFDNLRLAVKVQGEKLLSLTEQFYTEERAIRLTGHKGKIEWIRINKPELMADGSIRILNDITASAADFVVTEADYAGTFRQVMFDGISQLAMRLPPEVALRLFIIAMEFSDLPNKDDVAEAMRRVIGERDPNKPLSPEEIAQQEEQMRMQAEALQLQREQAALALAEQRARVEKMIAEAESIRAKAQGVPSEAMRAHEAKLRQIEQQAAARLDAMSEELRQVQAKAAAQIMALRNDADTKIEVARIEAASKERVAEIQAAAASKIDALMARLEEMNRAINDAMRQAQDAARAADAATKMAEKKSSEAANAERQSAPPVTINFESGAIQVDAKSPPVTKTITLQAGDQKVTGVIKQEGENQ